MQLNIEQKKIIEYKPSGHTLVKGVAGSGKTTVAVHRIPMLLEHYCFEEDDRVLFLTFNKTLAKYVKHIYNKLEQEKKDEVRSLLWNEKSIDKLEIKTVDSIMYSYFCDYKRKAKKTLQIATNTQINNILLKAIADIQKKYLDIKLINPQNINFLKDEIVWIKSCNYLELTEYQNADRLGRMYKNAQDGPQRIQKNSRTRNAIYDILVLYNKRMNDTDLLDFHDMALIAFNQVRENSRKKIYTYFD